MPKLVPVLAFLGLLAPLSARAGDEPAVQGEARTLPYLRAMHTKVHREWADNFLAMASAQLPKDHPVNLSSRAVELELLLMPDGKLAAVQVAKPSGAGDFDAAAVDVVKTAAPFGAIPTELLSDVLSDDGKAHILWTLARDDRRCSSLSILNKASAIDVAVTMLVAQGREQAALARLGAVADDVRQLGFSSFARAWLERARDSKDLVVNVAAANALAGDARDAEVLRQALGRRVDADMAARALASLNLPLCPLVKDKLDDASADARVFALSVLRFAPDGDCQPWLIAVAKDGHAPTAQRTLAIEALGRSNQAAAMAAVKDLLKDSAPAIKAAAILAEARAGAGKGAVFRLTASLHDPSLDIRVASAAALVRVGGEPALSQLFLLFKEKDPRPYQAVAGQLAWLTGQASADLLAHFLRKEDRRIRLAGALALARRQDSFARKAQVALAQSPDPELRFLAGSTVSADKRTAAATSPDGAPWLASYAALAEGSGKLAAMDWAIAEFPKLAPATRIDVLATWLAATRTRN
jgi:TonB family protein